MKILCVAEKPSIAKGVAQIMSGGSMRTRSQQSNGRFVVNYDYTFNFPEFGVCDVTMTAVAGHVTNIDFGPEFGWGKCNPETLFEAATVVKVSNPGVAENITNEAQFCDKLMIWTDCDREGEYIGWEVVEQARKSNRRLTVENALRARFSHVERAHILQAARNPIRLDVKAIEAVKTRMEVDLRTGACFTRYMTGLFQSALRGQDNIVSYGGCQFPTLGFVVDRYKRIKLFKSEPFWRIDLSIEKNAQTCSLIWEKGRLFDRLAVCCIYSTCLNMDHEWATVASIDTRPTSNWAPLPLTTVEMQKDCARFFKFTAKDTLRAAEDLYTKGFISYPRTETDTFPASMDLRKLVEKQQDSTKWGDYAKKLLASTFRQPRTGRHSDDAHPPIHPIILLEDRAEGFTHIQKTVYEYVVRRFLACCSPDAKGLRTTLEVRWGPEMFSTSGLIVKDRGYLEVYIYSHWTSSGVALPDVTAGERVKVAEAKIGQGKTSAPPKLTETELIALMDANGIGTDATIADHIDKIKTRNYVNVDRKVILPTELGYGLVEGCDRIGLDMSLSKPFMRRELEKKLTKICDGATTRQSVVAGAVDKYRDAYMRVTSHGRLLLDSYREAVAQNQ